MDDEKKLNIFISYGHVNNASSKKVPGVVDEIVVALKKRAHHVWLDVEQLPDSAITNWPDSDWRSAIYRAINDSDDVVGFLSERALRDCGVCLDELSIAVSKPGRRIVTVLLESQKTMKIPPTISRIQWVDMSDWEDHYDKQQQCFFDDGYFETKFSEIIERIEQEENFIYQYDINFLMQTLCPSNTINTDLIRLLERESDFNGNLIYEKRAWLEEKVFSFINDSEHYLLLTGGPGYGKSQFLAHCIHNIEDIYAYYFIKFDKNEMQKSCNILLRTIAFELAAKMPDYRSSLIDSIKTYPIFSESRLSEVLNFFLELSDKRLFDCLFHCDSIHFIDGNPGKIIISIDALDESEQDGNNPIVDLLIKTKDQWPRFFKFILSSRESGNILKRFDFFENDVQIVRMAVNESDEDVKKYLRKRLKTEDINDEEFAVLVQTCEKTFTYARLLVQSIEDGLIEVKTLADIHALPKGYNGLLQDYFLKAFSDEQFEEVKLPLGIMVANGGSIEKSVLERIMRTHVSGWSIPRFILQMKSFVELHGEYVCFYHKALNDWFNNSDAGYFFIDATLYKIIITSFCEQILDDFRQISEDDYADATGTDLFEDAEENGFDYTLMKFVYKSCLRFLKKADSKKFKKNEIVFLSAVLWEAYRHSDLHFVDEVFKVIKRNARHFENYSKRERFYLAIAYNTYGEVELARDNHIPNSTEINAQTVTADNCQTAIEYFWFVQKSFSELPEYGRLYGSVMDNIAFNTRLINHKSPESLRLALSILEDLREYEETKQYEDYENSLAHLFYHEGIIYYDMKQYEQALRCLDKAEDLIVTFYLDDYDLQTGFFSLVLNQRSACSNKIANTEVEMGKINIANEHYRKSLLDINESLNKKIKYFGPYSFYVATAYDNYARFLRDYEIAQPDFTHLSSTVYEYVKKAIEIKTMVFSESGQSTARSYMTLAFCYDVDRAYDENMIKYIRKAIAIDPETYKEDAIKLYQAAIQYYSKNQNNQMRCIFERELNNIKSLY